MLAISVSKLNSKTRKDIAGRKKIRLIEVPRNDAFLVWNFRPILCLYQTVMLKVAAFSHFFYDAQQKR